MSAETLAMAAGIILTLSFSYVPGLNTQFACLSPEYKRLIMLGLLILVSAGALGVACAGLGEVFGVTLTCDEVGLTHLAKALVAAIVANQGVYAISPRTKRLRKTNIGGL
jgi:hypothetical protein